MKKAVILALMLLAACSPATPAPVPTETVRAGTAAPTGTAEPTLTPSVTPTPGPVEWTGAILGLDFEPQRPGRNIYGIRSDVVMLYHIETTWDGETELTLISLPRDLWLQVPCSPLDPALEGNDRINAAWAYGQYDCFRDTIAANFPLTVDAPIVAFDFEGFLNIVDHFGGLEIVPTETYTDWCGSYHGTWGEHGRYLTWTKGETYQMDSAELLCYARARHGASDGDLDRNRRHLEIVEAAMKQWPGQVFDTPNPLDMAVEFKSLWTLFKSSYQTDSPFSAFVPFLRYVPAFWQGDVVVRTVSMNIEQEVDFYRTPVYGASVLKPKVDLYDWMGCELLTNGDEPCTAMFQLTPTPEAE